MMQMEKIRREQVSVCGVGDVRTLESCTLGDGMLGICSLGDGEDGRFGSCSLGELVSALVVGALPVIVWVKKKLKRLCAFWKREARLLGL